MLLHGVATVVFRHRNADEVPQSHVEPIVRLELLLHGTEVKAKFLWVKKRGKASVFVWSMSTAASLVAAAAGRSFAS